MEVLAGWVKRENQYLTIHIITAQSAIAAQVGRFPPPLLSGFIGFIYIPGIYNKCVYINIYIFILHIEYIYIHIFILHRYGYVGKRIYTSYAYSIYFQN